MRLKGIKVGMVMTVSCTMGDVLPAIADLRAEGAVITVVLSYTVDQVDTRFSSDD